MKDLDTMFITTNYEEKDSSINNAANDDLALMRFEFLEIIVRVAVAKYGKKQWTDDASEVSRVPSIYFDANTTCVLSPINTLLGSYQAVDMLVERNIKPCLCPEAVLDKNAFRDERLYFEPVAGVFENNVGFLTTVFNYYKARARI